MPRSDLIDEHREAVARFAAAPYGTVEFYQADAALVASFQRLNDRFSEADEDCALLRRQAS